MLDPPIYNVPVATIGNVTQIYVCIIVATIVLGTTTSSGMSWMFQADSNIMWSIHSAKLKQIVAMIPPIVVILLASLWH
jgi:hypothetical protein